MRSLGFLYKPRLQSFWIVNEDDFYSVVKENKYFENKVSKQHV